MISVYGSNGSKTSSNVGMNYQVSEFLGALAKLRKLTISFIMSVRLSAWKNSPLTRRIFIKFDI
jgi:hypothetical protein